VGLCVVGVLGAIAAACGRVQFNRSIARCPLW